MSNGFCEWCINGEKWTVFVKGRECRMKMEWRGEIRVNDGQKMEQNGVCNGMDPRERLVSVMDRKWSVIGCV